ncbi:hypothetical protein L7F22_066206 [Adiantum nelumboides]|nr:hypothetical protein [Adiantum nelumboides]
MKRIRSVVFDMNAHYLKLQLGCIKDVQAHFMEFKALIWVLEKSYDVILTGKEKVFLFIGTLPLHVGCDMACMELTNVKNMVYYLMSPVGQASYAYLDSCLEDASYDNYDSSFSVDEDASSLCDHDTSDVCSLVSSPPCVKGHGNVFFDVYDDDEGITPIGDMIMSDMPIWDVESSREEEPYVDMDAFMAMNAAKTKEEICVMESECEEVESCMWEAMDASNANEGALDWGFDEPNVEMNDEMKMNVIKAISRIDAMRDTKKNGRDGSAFDASNDVRMDGLESLFDKNEVDFGPVYDVDHAFEHMADGYKPFLFDPSGRRAVYLPVNWATVLWPFDPGGLGAVQDWRRGTISLYGKTGVKKLYNMDTRKVVEEPYEDENESNDEDYSTVFDKDSESTTSSDEDVDVAFLLKDKEIHESSLVVFANEG